MHLSEYIGVNNPEGVNRVLVRNGYDPCDYVEDCPNAIEFLIMEKGQDATEDLLMEHPDYDVIVALEKRNNGEMIAEQPIINNTPTMPPRVSSEISKPVLSDSLKEILVIIMAFWLLNKIISS